MAKERTNILVTKETRKRLMQMKLDLDMSSVDDVIVMLLERMEDKKYE